MYFLLWMYETDRDASKVSDLLTAVYEVVFISHGRIEIFVDPAASIKPRENASDPIHSVEYAVSTLRATHTRLVQIRLDKGKITVPKRHFLIQQQVILAEELVFFRKRRRWSLW
jgi:hypothetical protein